MKDQKVQVDVEGIVKYAVVDGFVNPPPGLICSKIDSSKVSFNTGVYRENPDDKGLLDFSISLNYTFWDQPGISDDAALVQVTQVLQNSLKSGRFQSLLRNTKGSYSPSGNEQD